MTRTGFIVNGRTDTCVFLLLPFLAMSIAFWAQDRLPAAAEASVALWITVPHHFATWLRTYGFSDERSRWRARLLAGPFIILGVTLAGMRVAPMTVLMLVFLWDHQPSIMQQYGFSRIYDFRAKTGGPETGRFDFWLNWVLYVNLFVASPLWTRTWVEMLYQWGLPISARSVSTIHVISSLRCPIRDRPSASSKYNGYRDRIRMFFQRHLEPLGQPLPPWTCTAMLPSVPIVSRILSRSCLYFSLVEVSPSNSQTC